MAECNINSVNLLIIFLELIQVRAGQQTTPLLEPTVLSRVTRYFSQHGQITVDCNNIYWIRMLKKYFDRDFWGRFRLACQVPNIGIDGFQQF